MKKHHIAPAERNRNELQKIFPAAFTEGKIDWAKLKNLLPPSLHEDTRERYGLDWVGKQQTYHRLQTSPTQTLRPCPQDSVDFDTSQHLFIEGENPETSKKLLRTYQEENFFFNQKLRILGVHQHG